MSKEIIIHNEANTIDSKWRNDNTGSRLYKFMPKSYVAGISFDHFPKNRYAPLNYEFSQALGTIAVTAGSVRLFKVRIYAPTTFDSLRVAITNATASNPYLLVYDSGSDGLPNNLIINTGPVVINGAAVYTFSITPTLLLPGLYWFGYLSDAATQYRGLAAANMFHVGVTSVSTAIVNCCASTRTYSLGPPNPHNLTKTFVSATAPVIAARAI